MTAVQDRPAGDTVALGRRGRLVRTVVAALGLLLITAGTLHGSDDDFPFGPLRMYATRDDPNGSVAEAVVLATTTTGAVLDVTNTGGAPRRAELEGRFTEFSDDSTHFADVARQYVTADGHVRGHSDAVAVRIALVRRLFPLHDGKRSATSVDLPIAAWTPHR